MYEYGRRVRELRIENKLSVNVFANILGVVGSTISAIETGKNYPSIQILEKICDYFEISLSEFFSESGLEENEKDSIDEQAMLNLWRGASKENKENILKYLKDNKKLEIISSDSENISIINAYRMASEPEKMAINALLDQYKIKEKVLKKNA